MGMMNRSPNQARNTGSRSRPRHLGLVLLAALAAWVSPRSLAGDEKDQGKRTYRELCASCHGASGQGVDGKHADPLVGEKSVLELARYIEKWMPEEEPERCVGEDAERVARYIHEAFYSPIARARHREARIELSRLTVSQYRNSVADLIGSFRPAAPRSAERGLRGEYFDSRRPGRNRAFERLDPEVRFAFRGNDTAPEKLSTEGFSVRWTGSLLAPETGEYELIVRTDHSGRFWLNDLDEPLIDAWVKSGDDTEHRASIFLVGGRAYPLRLEFSSRKQGVKDKKKSKEPVEAFIELLWELPGRVPEVIRARHLAPAQPPEVFVADTPFPPDDRSIGYERGTAISEAWDDATTTGAIETAGYVTAHLEELSGIEEDDPDRESKLREFAARLVTRAFRRPLTDALRELYVGRQIAGSPDLETAVRRVVILALKSPRFLYLDFGNDSPDGYAVASRLSFALWDSLPDRELLDAAAGGRLASREEVARQAERMIDDPRTRAKLRGFLHHWLDLDRARELSKDEERFPDFDQKVVSDLRTSLDLFLDDVLWNEGGDFRRLLLSRDLYLNGRLAEYYGFDLPADAGFRKVRSDEPERAGVLSHPYLMASFAYSDVSSPIHRGVFLVRNVLGRGLRPPPEAFTPVAPDLHPDLTTRERVAMQTRPEACQACHGMINPLGFALERFDAVGRPRKEENGKRIDASGWYEQASGTTENFDGARELAEYLAANDETHRAFATQLFHHLVKQPVFAYGSDTPEELREVFAASGFDIRRLTVETATRAARKGMKEGMEEAGTPAPPVSADGSGSRVRRRVRL